MTESKSVALPLGESPKVGGGNRARTYDPLLVRQMLSQLSYTPTLERVKRIELSQPAWKAGALPLSYTRIFLVEGEGFEPSKSQITDLQSAPFGHSGTPPKIWSR